MLLIDVQGVGYEVFAPMTTIYQLPDVGAQVTLHTHFVVREDAQQLYGFVERSDRELFRILIKVNGVGPKMAIGIMSGMEAKDLVRCVRSDNVAALTQIPGIGKKTAERLLIELRDKLAEWDIAGLGNMHQKSHQLQTNDSVTEAESALVALGYKPQEASRMVSAIVNQTADSSASVLNSQELIRLALRAAVKV